MIQDRPPTVYEFILAVLNVAQLMYATYMNRQLRSMSTTPTEPAPSVAGGGRGGSVEPEAPPSV